jgi:methionyl aminopeptidase
MITIKNRASIQKMEKAGVLLSEIFSEISSFIQKGVSTHDIDLKIEEMMFEKGVIPQCKGYSGYEHVSCISVNDDVVHGVPSKTKILKDGDLVKVDTCVSWQGYCADMARCYFVGEASEEIKKMVSVAQVALDKGIAQAKPGNRLSDISAAIQEEVDKHGYGIVRDFAGHGIGKRMHEAPEILNYGKPGQGPLLKPGMTFAIEPMITMGTHKVFITEDGWTVKTADKSMAAHVEDTIVVTENKPKILTRTEVGDK